MKKLYYIYHIPGVKIGCTDNLKRRMREQGFTHWEILEIHTDINVANIRERQLQKHGYPGSSSINKMICKNRKLTFEDAEEIRRIYIKGDKEFGGRPLARRYGVSQPVIHQILQGKTYLS